MLMIPIDKNFACSLDGKWRFKLENDGAASAKPLERTLPDVVDQPFEPFHMLDYAEDATWHDFVVPGNWEMAGYSPATYWNPDNASGEFRHWFTVPVDWKGRVVKINFDGVQNGAEVWVNGKPVPVTEPSWGRDNYHESGWTAWQADITSAVKFGETNLLAIRVTKLTKSAPLDSGDYYFLGGVYRPVTLFSVPATHISDLTITTHPRPGNKAEVKVVVDAAGPDRSTVQMKLEGQEPLEAEVWNHKAWFSQVVSKPKLWSAEYPNLYDLEVILKDSSGKETEKVTRRVGIREVTTKGGVLYVNGEIVKLAGICRHDLSAKEGCAVGEELWRKDLALMKAANLNSIRTSHYPYGAGFYDMCDEMGFYVLDELPYCWAATDAEELTPAFEQRARETIARDKNHACVIIWGIGNENRPGRSLQVVADLVMQLDPTRPRLVSEMPADLYGVELDDKHYVSPSTIESDAKDKERRPLWPKVYSENPNVFDVRYASDYGCLEIWGEVMKRTWDVILKHDGIAGTYLWEWQDRAVCDKCPTKLYRWDEETGTNYVKVKGIVDSRRNVRPDHYQLKMALSPIQAADKIDLKSQPGSAVLEIANQYSFTDLSGIRTKWRLTKDGKLVKSGTAKLKLAPRSSGKVALPLPSDQVKNADALRVDFDHPQGYNVITCEFQLAKPKARSRMVAKLPDGLALPVLNLVTRIRANESEAWRRDYLTKYQLANIKSKPASPEQLSELRSFDADVVSSESWHVPSDPTPTAEQLAKANPPKLGETVGRVHAEFANGQFSYRIEWSGAKADIQELGWTLRMPKTFDRFSWDREAGWSYYPDTHIGRARGTALPDTMNVNVLEITRPDAFDFNSTKFDCNWASLTNAEDQGLRVEFGANDRHQVRGGETGGRYDLIVNKLCCPPRDFSTNCVPDLYFEMEPGKAVEGSFKVGSNRTLVK
jgi:beta-galactosidase